MSGASAKESDAFLEVIAGPSRVGERFFLHGSSEVGIGRQEGLSIILKGERVSRRHCRLVRESAGPSRWRIIDDDSDHGLFIEERRIAERALADGDTIRIGEYQLRYWHFDPIDQPVTMPAPPPLAKAKPKATSGAQPVRVIPVSTKVCASCRQALPHDAKLCVDCGIDPITGRPVLISHGRDEFALHEVADKWVRATSWILWFTPLPIPLSSDAYGRRRPWATWLIIVVTVIASIAFYVAARQREGVKWEHPGHELMLWPPKGKARVAPDLPWHVVEGIISQLEGHEREEFDKRRAELKGTVSERELDRRTLQSLISDRHMPSLGKPGEFKRHQLITHAFLHNTTSLLGLTMHLGMNMAFLWVFGSRVNAILGNFMMLLVYPALAVGSALVDLRFGDPTGPSLGASGAVMGLGGMYLILFPVHPVYCTMWLRFFLQLEYSIFTIRGFWLLLCYFVFDAVQVALRLGGNVGHWAHMGGFVTGVALSLLLLFSRVFNCGGGDLLSVTMGRHAWWFIGKPARWRRREKRRLARSGEN